MAKNITGKPMISVLMSAYNAGKYVHEAIDSILKQTFKDFEFIIIDDASTDNTRKIISSFVDKRIKLIKNKRNLGLARSLNKGLGLCSGKYIARMDADDISLPDRLDTQFNHLKVNKDTGIVGSWIECFDGRFNKKIIKYPVNNDEIRSMLLFDCVIAHPSVLMRKSVLDKYKLRYDHKMLTAGDYEFWSKVITKTKISNINKVLLLYRIHRDQMTKGELNMDIYKNKIREILLRNALKINNGVETHNTICSDLFKFDSIHNIDMTVRWFEHLKERNRLHNYCDNKVFEKVLAEYYGGIALKTKFNNFNLFYHYLKQSRLMGVGILKNLVILKNFYI